MGKTELDWVVEGLCTTVCLVGDGLCMQNASSLSLSLPLCLTHTHTHTEERKKGRKKETISKPVYILVFGLVLVPVPVLQSCTTFPPSTNTLSKSRIQSCQDHHSRQS